MDSNAEMLNCIYQNAKMGTDSIHTLLPKVEETNLRNELLYQQQQYDEYVQKAQDLAHQYSTQVEEEGPFTKMMSTAGIHANTILDHSPAKVAEMMIQGSTMGIIDMTKQLKGAETACPQVKQLGNELLSFEQHALEKMKAFL